VNANDNNQIGIYILTSEKIALENIEANGNDDDGINIRFCPVLDLSLRESISLNANGRNGLLTYESSGNIALFGELNANNNRVGIGLYGGSIIFSIAYGASLSACDNDDGGIDIDIGSGNTLTLIGDGTCTGTTVGVGTIPDCGDCP
jgi:hypothetical protein